MAIIGSAHVVIRAITNKLESDIEKGLSPAVKSAGDKASKDLSQSIQNGMKNIELSDDAINTSKATKKAGDNIKNDLSSVLKSPISLTELNLQTANASKRAADKLTADIHKNLKTAGLKVPAPKNILADWTPDTAGKNYTDRLNRSISSSGFRIPAPSLTEVEKSLTKVNERFKTIGKDANIKAPSVDISNAVNNLDLLRQKSDYTNTRVSTSARENAKQVELSWSQAFKNSNSSLMSNFGSGNISTIMKRMFYQMLFGVPVIGALVGALASLASGLFAMGAAVGPAVNALAILPGILGAVVAGVGATVLAFGGIGTAFSAGNKALSGIGSSAASSGAAAARAANTTADAYETAAERIASAQEDAANKVVAANLSMQKAQEKLSDVLYRNAKNLVSVQREMRNSEESLAAAQSRAKSAQLGINTAREEAIDNIKELQFSVEGAAIAEGRAVIALERAREKLAEVNELPPDHRLRREAQLNYDAAELDLRRAQKSNVDLAKEQAETVKKGVEGSDKVVSAVQAEIEAQRDLRDAKEAASDAAQSYTENELESARDLRDARQDIIDIEQDLIDIQTELGKSVAKANADLAKSLRDVALSAGSSGAAGGVDAFADAMKKLSPEAQSFVRYMLSVKDTFKVVRDEAGRELFPKLEEGIQRLIDGGFLDILSGALRDAGGAVGDLAIDIADLSADKFFQGQFETFMDSNVKVLGFFNDAIVNLITVFTNIGVAAAPVTEEFAKWIATITGNWAKNTTDDMEGLNRKITDGAAVAKKLGDIFGNLWGLIKDVGHAATPAGKELLDSFNEALVKLREFTSSADGQNQLKDYFDAIVPNVKKVADMFGTLSTAFLGLGDNPAIGQVADIISERVIPAFELLLDSVTTNVGPEMAGAFASLVEVFEVVAAGGGLTAFVNIIKTAADGLLALTSIPGFTTFISAFAVFVGSYKALSLITQITGLKTMAVGLTGIVKDAAAYRTALVTSGIATTRFGALQTILAKKFPLTTKALKAVTAGFKLLGRAMFMNPIGLIVVGITALVAAFIWAWNNIDGFKEFFVALWEGIKNAWAGVSEFFTDLWDTVVEIFFSVIDIIKDIFFKFHPLGIIIKNWDAIAEFFSELWDGIVDTIKNVFKIIKDLFFKFHIIGIIIKNWEAIATFFSNLWDGILETFKTVLTNISNVVTPWLDAIRAIPGNVAASFVNMWDALSNGLQAAVDFVNTLINGLVDFVFGLPGQFMVGLALVWDAIWTTLDPAIKVVRTAIDGMISFVTGLPARIIAAVKTMWEIMYGPIASIVTNIKGAFNGMVSWVGGLPARIITSLSNLWGIVSSGATTAKDAVVSKFNEMLGWVGGLGSSIAAKASNMWDGIKDAFKSALNWIIDKWNGLSFSIPGVDAFGKTIGGVTFSVPQIPRFAEGGVVAPSPGGTLGIIAEAGKTERITPLDSDGLSAGERMMLNALETRQGGDITIQIIAQPNQDVQLLAKLVSRELAFRS